MAPRYFEWVRRTGLMGAVRPQTPHRSPRQAFGGNFCVAVLTDSDKMAGLQRVRMVKWESMDANKLFNMALGLRVQ
jgi:hypothetical protein